MNTKLVHKNIDRCSSVQEENINMGNDILENSSVSDVKRLSRWWVLGVFRRIIISSLTLKKQNYRFEKLQIF